VKLAVETWIGAHALRGLPTRSAPLNKLSKTFTPLALIAHRETKFMPSGFDPRQSF
jgi:hypothetical protein